MNQFSNQIMNQPSSLFTFNLSFSISLSYQNHDSYSLSLEPPPCFSETRENVKEGQKVGAKTQNLKKSGSSGGKKYLFNFYWWIKILLIT